MILKKKFNFYKIKLIKQKQKLETNILNIDN